MSDLAVMSHGHASEGDKMLDRGCCFLSFFSRFPFDANGGRASLQCSETIDTRETNVLIYRTAVAIVAIRPTIPPSGPDVRLPSVCLSCDVLSSRSSMFKLLVTRAFLTQTCDSGIVTAQKQTNSKTNL